MNKFANIYQSFFKPQTSPIQGAQPPGPPRLIIIYKNSTHSPKTKIRIFNSDLWEKPKRKHEPHYDFHKLFPGKYD